MRSRPSHTERVAALALGALAVVSPLYIDRKPPAEQEIEGGGGGIPGCCWPPLFLVVLVSAIGFTRFLDRRYTRFDPYWIHRVGGSSCGLVFLLLVLVLALVLKCKAGVMMMS